MDRAEEISHLLDLIHTHGRAIQKYMQHGSLLGVGAGQMSSSHSLLLPPDLEQPREHILDAIDQLRMLLLGPVPYIAELSAAGVSMFASTKLRTDHRG